MSRLRHPNIVQFLGVCYLPGSQLPVLLMEKLQTSLDNLLETNPNIPIHIKLHFLTGTSRGVVYLHSHSPPIVHRDLSARNVLIDSGRNAKIADMGVARMVNIQPGQLAATMTRAPGANLYMPPEAVHDEGSTRYSTSIDIFSFGVIALFTLTQTFPKNLKPPNYRDPKTRRLVARTEIERREVYIQLMKTNLGSTHSLVGLTLSCLEYDQEDRPSAVAVLRQLREVGMTVPQNCHETKLELLRRLSLKEEEIVQIRRQLERQQRLVLEKDTQLSHPQSENSRQKQQFEGETRRLSDQVRSLQRLISERDTQFSRLQNEHHLQKQQLEVQQTKIQSLESEYHSSVEIIKGRTSKILWSESFSSIAGCSRE